MGCFTIVIAFLLKKLSKKHFGKAIPNFSCVFADRLVLRCFFIGKRDVTKSILHLVNLGLDNL